VFTEKGRKIEKGGKQLIMRDFQPARKQLKAEETGNAESSPMGNAVELRRIRTQKMRHYTKKH